MALVASQLYQKYRKAMASFGFIIRTSKTSDIDTDPSISAGSAAPTAAEPTGAVYIRTTAGTLYQRLAAGWVATIDAVKTRTENGVVGRSALTAELADLTALRSTLASVVTDVTALVTRVSTTVLDSPSIQQATTNGRLKLGTPCGFRVAGVTYNKPGTDDLWNLSAKGTLDGTHYLAHYLYIDSAGTATVVDGTQATSQALAVAALPAQDTSKCLFAIVVGQPNCNYANALLIPASIVVAYLGASAAITQGSAAPAALTTTSTVGIGNGTTAGRLRTNTDIDYAIAGTMYRKASTDDLWNLSAQTATSGTNYRAFWLYLDSAGTATIAAGTNATTADGAIAALPAVTSTKSVIGVYVANPSTTFTNALVAQGTVYNGWPGTAFT